MKKIMKTDNKGFSLIELIIVIAIMAVLVALIAPNLTKYLGSSKKTADEKNLDEVKKQVESCIADAATQDITIAAGKMTIEGTGSAQVTITGSGGGTDFQKLVISALGKANTASKVTPANKAIEVEIEVNGADISVKSGSVQFVSGGGATS